MRDINDLNYCIDIESDGGVITVSPESQLKLLDGGITGFDSGAFDVEIGAYAESNGGYVKRRRFAEREIGLRFEICENVKLWKRRICSLISPLKDCVIHAAVSGEKRKISAVPCKGPVFEQDNFFDMAVCSLSFIAPEPFFTSEKTAVTEFSDRLPLLNFPLSFLPKIHSGYVVNIDSKTAVNEGDAECGLVITVSASGGSVTNPSVSCGGRFVRVLAVLDDGDELKIDTRKRHKGVYINGESKFIFDRRSTFFSLPDGESCIEIDADSGKEFMAVKCEYSPLYFGI